MLENGDNERDFGVWISNNLFWRKQESKANKMLGFIKRSTRTMKNCKARRTLYITLVRSQMGDATQVWSPQIMDLIARLERVQRRASRYILDLRFFVKAATPKGLLTWSFYL